MRESRSGQTARQYLIQLIVDYWLPAVPAQLYKIWDQDVSNFPDLVMFHVRNKLWLFSEFADYWIYWFDDLRQDMSC